MRIQSPLSNLRDVLNQVRDSAKNYKKALMNNEAANRAVLIDPVLRTLGWDTANTYMVEVEKTLNQIRADYALYDNGGNVRFVIEAKKLGEKLDQHDQQLVSYAFTFKIGDVFLTDGLIWRHYTDFQPQDFAPTKVLDIGHDDLGEVAAYLVQHVDAAKFWPEEQNVDTLAQQITQLQSDLATLQQEIAALKGTGYVTSINREQPPATSTLSTAVSPVNYVDLEALPNLRNTKPVMYRRPDGQEIKVRTWKQILVESCKLALSTNSRISLPFSDRSGRKVNLLDVNQPSKEVSYLTMTYAGQEIYLYANYDANNCIANALHILTLVPAAKKTVTPAVVLAESQG